MWKTPWLLPEAISLLREQSSNTWNRSTLKRLLSLTKIFKTYIFFSTALIATEYLIIFTILDIREGNGTPFQYSCLKIPWMEEPGRLQSMGLLRVGHDWATSLSLFTFMHWRRQWQPTPVFLPGESQGRRSLVGCRLWGHTESDTTEVTWHSIA